MNLSNLPVAGRRIFQIPQKTVDFINGINSYVFITLLLWLFFFRFELNVNEEHYMALARQFQQPDWVRNSFSLSGFSGTKVLYEIIVGYFLTFLPFEVVAAIGRLLLSMATAFPLMRLYQQLQLSNIDILLHIPILYLPQQSFFGQEWMLVTLESKGLAYVFVLFALVYTLRENYRYAMLFAVAATYFHLLVGGWYAVYCCLHHLANKKSLRQTIPLGLMYLGLLIPFFIYLAPIFRDNFTEPADLNLDWLFTYFRQPYHTALFASVPYFIKNHLDGVLISTAFFLIGVLVYRRIDDDWNRKMNLFNVLMYTGTFLCLVAAYFDRTGAFVKYFPFRINAMFAFLIFLQTVYLLRHFFIRQDRLKELHFAIFIWFFFTIFPRTFYGLAVDVKNYFFPKTTDFDIVCDYIRNNTEKGDVILPLSRHTDIDNYETYEVTPTFQRSLIREMERDLFVSFSFAPIYGGSQKLVDWYQRLQVKREMLQNQQLICPATDNYKINYILADFALEENSCYQLIYNQGEYFLYELGID